MIQSIRHFVSATQVDNALASQLIARAEAFKNGAPAAFTRPTYATNLFFEPSTRTQTSFQMAEAKLGMTTLAFDPGQSSLNKGETLGDTLKTLASIGVDVAVIRHPEDGYYRHLIDDNIPLHLVNGGDGEGQHPSQMLLDLMTIHEAFGDFRGLRVGIVGDLAHSRVARSDMTALHALGAEIAFGGPQAWYTPEFAAVGPHLPTDELVAQVDVLMLLRVQLERLSEAELAEFSPANYHARFGVTEARAANMKPHAILMHPAPVNRGVELAGALVEAPQSRIFTQMHNGVFMRMAMLEYVLATD